MVAPAVPEYASSPAPDSLKPQSIDADHLFQADRGGHI